MKAQISLLAISLFFLASPVSGDELAILSPHWEGIRHEFAEGFAAHFQKKTGRTCSIRWLDVGGASDIVRFVKSEFASKHASIGADLVFGGGTDPFIELSRGGYLAPYTLSLAQLTRIPKEINGVPLYDPQYTWYATALSTFGILYNRDVLVLMNLPEVTEWKDLADPRLKSWIGVADPRKSGSIHLMYEAILQSYGWKEGWSVLFGIGVNARNFSNQASQVVKDIASGEVAYGLAIDSYAFEMIRKYGNDSLRYVVPKDRSPVTGDAIGILRGAPNQEAAESFVEYVLSDEGQKLFYFKRGGPSGPKRYELAKLPVVPDLYDTAENAASRSDRPFDSTSSFRYDAEKAAKRWTLVNDLIGTWIVDNRDLLSNTSVIDGAPPVSETEIDSLLSSDYQSVRSRLIRDWSVAARSRTDTSSPHQILRKSAPAVLLLVFLVLSTFFRRKSSF